VYLATLPRFEPSLGFADRVMARVAIEKPGAVTIPARRAAVPAVFKRPVFGWSVAASSAFSTTALTVWIAANLDAISATVTAVTMDAGATAWQALLGLLATWLVSVTTAAGSVIAVIGQGTITGLGIAAVLAMPLSILGLLLAFRPALHSRMRLHAAR
jgi:hypothetical protein